MSNQIAVSLPDGVVEYVDRAITEGRATSRATAIIAALERQMRRDAVDADLHILRTVGPDDDLDALIDWTGAHSATQR